MLHLYDQLYIHILFKAASAPAIFNERTQTNCYSTYDYRMQYKSLPLLNIRPINWKAAIAELLGYLKGSSNAAQFRELGTKTWDANANENKAWLSNPNRKGNDDMGRVYGVQGRSWLSPVYDKYGLLDGTVEIDQLAKIVNNLKQGIDDRGEILSFWNPGEFDQGCLRPCLYEHHFTIQQGKLCLTSTQRSCDLGLGYGFNAIQCYVLLAIIAKITGLPMGHAIHNIVNAHIYENQMPAVDEMLDRYANTLACGPTPELVISDKLTTLEYLTEHATLDDFDVIGYKPLDPLTNKIPFSV